MVRDFLKDREGLYNAVRLILWGGGGRIERMVLWENNWQKQIYIFKLVKRSLSNLETFGYLNIELEREVVYISSWTTV